MNILSLIMPLFVREKDVTGVRKPKKHRTRPGTIPSSYGILIKK
jgi:hypothetical protein